jgi:hypothetical protein
VQYQVVPFTAGLKSGETSNVAAGQLERLINEQAAAGWNYARLESIATTVVTPMVPGNNGCLGLGAVPGRPERRDSVEINVAVFERPS